MQPVQKVEVLSKSPIFTELNQPELVELASLATERSLLPGEYIFWEGDPPHWFYIVAQGKVKVLKHASSGKEFIIAFFGPGEMFGEVAVFEGKSYPASAQALVQSLVLGIRRAAFLDFLTRHPQGALKIISVLGGRLRDAQERLTTMAGERVEQRLTKVLLMLSSRLGPTLPFTRQDIADMTGTTLETTIRVLSRLKEGGIIHSPRGKIIITDKTKLHLLAGGPPKI